MKKIIVKITYIMILVLIMATNNIYATSSVTDTSQDEKSNNFLSELKVDGYELSPEFNKYTLTYYLVIPSNIASVNVIAETENEKSTVKISGNTNLSSKENTIKITVTSQNRRTRTYSIIATKQEDNGLRLSELDIEGTNINESLSEFVYNYSAEILTNKDESDLNITAIPSVENAEVEIIGNTGLGDGEHLITIILRNGQNTTIYEIKVNITVEKTIVSEVKNNDTMKNIKEYITEFLKDDNKVIALLVAFACILFILVIIFIVKIKNKNKIEKNKENLRNRAK